MNVKRARKKSNYIYPRQKCIWVYEEVGFVFIFTLNSICNVLLVYDMSHEKKRTHTKNYIQLEQRSNERKRVRVNIDWHWLERQTQFRCVRNRLNNYNSTCTISFAIAIATWYEKRADWLSGCRRERTNGKRLNWTKPNRMKRIAFARSDAI